jgi:hypothetical protein
MISNKKIKLGSFMPTYFKLIPVIALSLQAFGQCCAANAEHASLRYSGKEETYESNEAEERIKLWDFQILTGRFIHKDSKGIMAGFGIGREVYFGRMGISISINGIGNKDHQYYVFIPRLLWKLLALDGENFSLTGDAGLSYGFSGLKYNPKEVTTDFGTLTEYEKYRSNGAIFEAELGTRMRFHKKMHGVLNARCSLPLTPDIGHPIVSLGFGVPY